MALGLPSRLSGRPSDIQTQSGRERQACRLRVQRRVDRKGASRDHGDDRARRPRSDRVRPEGPDDGEPRRSRIPPASVGRRGRVGELSTVRLPVDRGGRISPPPSRHHEQRTTRGKAMTTAARPAKETRQPRQLPAPNSDFYDLYETLNPEELAIVKQVRGFRESKVAPIITKYWVDDSFPFELLPGFEELNIGGLGMQGYGCRGGSL